MSNQACHLTNLFFKHFLLVPVRISRCLGKHWVTAVLGNIINNNISFKWYIIVIGSWLFLLYYCYMVMVQFTYPIFSAICWVSIERPHEWCTVTTSWDTIQHQQPSCCYCSVQISFLLYKAPIFNSKPSSSHSLPQHRWVCCSKDEHVLEFFSTIQT